MVGTVVGAVVVGASVVEGAVVVGASVVDDDGAMIPARVQVLPVAGGPPIWLPTAYERAPLDASAALEQVLRVD